MLGAGSVRQGRARAVRALVLGSSLALACAGCTGRYGSIRFDNEVMRGFATAQVLPGHRYYTTGSETEPDAIVALREDRPLRGAWREIAATPAVLTHLTDRMRGTRLVGPDGAVILDDQGKRIGVWCSYHPYPPPPRLLDDGGVELNPPATPSGDDSSGRRELRP